jgi:hypothetical protein
LCFANIKNVSKINPIIKTEERGTLSGMMPIYPRTIAVKNSMGIIEITIKFAEHNEVLFEDGIFGPNILNK